MILYSMFTFQSSQDAIANGELYTSAEELSSWPNIREIFHDEVVLSIKAQEDVLYKLYRLRDTLLDLEKQDNNLSLNATDGSDIVSPSSSSQLTHPVKAFVSLNRIIKALNEIYSLFEDDYEELNKQGQLNTMQIDLKALFEHITSRLNLPTDDDLVGCGAALLRLRAFYELSIDEIVLGQLTSDHEHSQDHSATNKIQGKDRMMESEDCFELGRIAYDFGHYTESIKWFQKALELTQDRFARTNDELAQINDTARVPITASHVDVNEILEYMAFAAYKSGQIKYSAQLTRLWLERDPHNERAQGNLNYYDEELDYISADHKCSDDEETTKMYNERLQPHEEPQLNLSNVYFYNEKFNPANYVVEEDKIVRDLCRANNNLITNSKCNCIVDKTLAKNYMISPETKIEILNVEPYIVRIHDIISDQEAEYLRKLALPKLSRSTVQSKAGLTTSDFRIAKTAWLSKESDPIVCKIEKRLSGILNLNFHGSEDIQVVNYGLGGFYGPHLDSARESSIDTYNSVPISNLASNDRLATILLYLNQVEAGGSTVFPRLNLTVLPMERSAVVWYNIKRNGLSDEQTLHTGCPVLLGSKWIATKWPREVANSFIRPCGLDKDV